MRRILFYFFIYCSFIFKREMENELVLKLYNVNRHNQDELIQFVDQHLDSIKDLIDQILNLLINGVPKNFSIIIERESNVYIGLMDRLDLLFIALNNKRDKSSKSFNSIIISSWFKKEFFKPLIWINQLQLSSCIHSALLSIIRFIFNDGDHQEWNELIEFIHNIHLIENEELRLNMYHVANFIDSNWSDKIDMKMIYNQHSLNDTKQIIGYLFRDLDYQKYLPLVYNQIIKCLGNDKDKRIDRLFQMVETIYSADSSFFGTMSLHGQILLSILETIINSNYIIESIGYYSLTIETLLNRNQLSKENILNSLELCFKLLKEKKELDHFPDPQIEIFRIVSSIGKKKYSIEKKLFFRKYFHPFMIYMISPSSRLRHVQHCAFFQECPQFYLIFQNDFSIYLPWIIINAKKHNLFAKEAIISILSMPYNSIIFNQLFHQYLDTNHEFNDSLANLVTTETAESLPNILTLFINNNGIQCPKTLTIFNTLLNISQSFDLFDITSRLIQLMGNNIK
ncbi:hypothetical protein DFA_09482 [Cavenderia fasciculata]|uniref:Uncharacterized protein n=1 Tax=Cavenderia fasciculata TaxID=261658 RepID=F4Q7R3_CACFS|nr:uncharacterized protein DFA_09482 [Cavenderia fasciculata]EGG15813.1 hypothetical protein DFA_09482 [Cavenderia fasciculata]|eukprot:XP_004352138.1 hypothetical protein DFA_09482 [Cavenderia fasciculata]